MNKANQRRHKRSMLLKGKNKRRNEKMADLEKYRKAGKEAGTGPRRVYIAFTEGDAKHPGFAQVKKLKSQGYDLEAMVYDMVLAKA